MIVEIPGWLLWTLALVLGVPTVIAVVLSAVLGVWAFQVLTSMRRR